MGYIKRKGWKEGVDQIFEGLERLELALEEMTLEDEIRHSKDQDRKKEIASCINYTRGGLDTLKKKLKEKRKSDGR